MENEICSPSNSPIDGGELPYEHHRVPGTRIRSTITHRELLKEARANPTPAEKYLWKYLQGRQLLGLKFRRQHGVGPYIADFYCDQYKLIIEVDGDIHLERGVKENDEDRQNTLEQLGYLFVRATNSEVLKNINVVLRRILATVQSNPLHLWRG